MEEQDPTNLNNDKFTLTLRDGVTHPTDILASLQNRENQTITQNTSTFPTLSHTQEDAIINAEAAPSSILITPDDTITPQDTTLSPPSTAHDVSSSSMEPSTAFTPNSDLASTIANSNQGSKNLSQFPDSRAKPLSTQRTRSYSDSGSMEAFGYVHEGRGYELDNAKDEISTLQQRLKKAEIEITNLKQEVKKRAIEKSDLERTANTVTGDKARLKKQVLELDSANQSLEREQKRLKMELEKEKDQRRGKNDEMEGLEATIQKQKQSLELQNVHLKKLQQEALIKDKNITYANGEHDKLKEEIKTLQQKSKTQTGQVKGDAKKLAIAQGEIKHLKEEHNKTLKGLQENVERLTIRLRSQPKTEWNEMKQEFAETQKNNTRLELEIENLRTEMSRLEEELRKVQARADKAQAKLKAQGSNNKDTKKVETAGQKIEIPYETHVEQEGGPTDVPIVEQLAISVSNNPAVTVIEEPKLPNAEAEAKEQGSDAEISELTGPQWENGQTSKATEAGIVINTNALEKAEDHHTQNSQEADPFTEAHVSVEHPAASRDRDHDDSSSSVCSTTELSIDDRTPRALRRPLGQEGIYSRGQSTATDFSVAKCEKWIHRTSHYVEKSMQTDSVKLMEEMGVQTEPVPVKFLNGKKLSAEKDQAREVEKGSESSAGKDQDTDVEKGSEPQSKEEIPELHQPHWCCKIPSSLLLLMLLFYLGICCLAWSSWSATTAERNLWTSANSALTHGALLHENGSWPQSALSHHFANYRKM